MSARWLVWAVLGSFCCQASDLRHELAKVKRVFVEPLGSGESATQIRDMLIATLEQSKLFLLTESADRADAILRGSAEDLIYTETHESRESVDARASIGGAAASQRSSGVRSIRGASVGVGESESSRSTERRHEASISVRLINKDGDVIWSTIQESKGGKFRGAAADVTQKVAKTLAADMARSAAEKPK